MYLSEKNIFLRYLSLFLSSVYNVTPNVVIAIIILADSSRHSWHSQTVDNSRYTESGSWARLRAVTKFKIFTYFQATAHPSAPVITRCNQRTPLCPPPKAPLPSRTAAAVFCLARPSRNRINCSYLINGRYNAPGRQTAHSNTSHGIFQAVARGKRGTGAPSRWFRESARAEDRECGTWVNSIVGNVRASGAKIPRWKLNILTFCDTFWI